MSAEAWKLLWKAKTLMEPPNKKKKGSGRQRETTKRNEKWYEGFEPVETPPKGRCPYLNCRV